MVVILDTFFLRNIARDPDEITFLRDLWTALNGSEIVRIFRETIIPAFFTLFGLFIPESIKVYYPGTPA